MIQLKAEKNTQIFNSKPEDQLHQIWLQQDQQLPSHQQSLFGHTRSNKPTYKQQVNNNKDSSKSMEQQISQWGQPQSIKAIKGTYNNKNAVVKRRSELICRKQNSIRVVEISENCLQLDSDQRFLSMAELCHRYTFINQHNSHNISDSKQPLFKSNIKSESPNKITLRLQDPQQFIIDRRKAISLNFKMKYSNPPKFPTMRGEHDSLPSLRKCNKSQQITQKRMSQYQLAERGAREERYPKRLLHQKASKGMKINWKIDQTCQLKNKTPESRTKQKVSNDFRVSKRQQDTERSLEKHLVMRVRR